MDQKLQINLIKQAKLIIEKYAEIDKLTGKNFNIFKAGNIGHIETFHTRLISEILSPTGKHNQGDSFLKIFLKKIGLKHLIKNLKDTNVYAEYQIDNKRRIDIVIEGDDFIVGIEAKIYATDSDKQLKDYYEFLKKKNNFFLFYLTLDGHQPLENSLEGLNDEEKDKIQLISFKFEIYDFINECIKKVSDIPNLRDSLLIYKDLIEKLTNKDIQKEKEMVDKLLNTKENMEAVSELIRAYEIAWAKKEYDFWGDLYELVEKKVSSSWEDGDDIFYKNKEYSVFYKDRDKEKLLEEEESIKEIQNLRFSNSQNNHLGIAFKRKFANYTIYIVLGYWNGSDYSWLGVEMKKNDKHISSNEIQEFLENKNIHLPFEEKDDISLYNCIDNLKFASKNNLEDNIDLFDNQAYEKRIMELSKELIEIIKEIDSKLK